MEQIYQKCSPYWIFVRRHWRIGMLIFLFAVPYCALLSQAGIFRHLPVMLTMFSAAIFTVECMAMLKRYIAYLDRRITADHGPVWTIFAGRLGVAQVPDTLYARIRRDVYLSPDLYGKQACVLATHATQWAASVIMLLPAVLIVCTVADGDVKTLHTLVDRLQQIDPSRLLSLVERLFGVVALLLSLAWIVRMVLGRSTGAGVVSVFETEISERLKMRFHLDGDLGPNLYQRNGHQCLKPNERGGLW